MIPVVDGVSLIERLATAGLAESGSHDGLVPEFYHFGPLDLHYMGPSEPGREDGRTVILGCECGEWGCNPIFCSITVETDYVRWSEFCGHEGDASYRAFGPFVFPLVDYKQALEAAGLVDGG